jgi:replicative DNA helicase
VRNVDRIAPHSIEAEQSILGACLVDGKAVSRALEALTASDFTTEGHRSLMAVFESLRASDTPVDPITVCSALAASGDLDRVGGPEYLSALAGSVPTSCNAEHYAAIVRDTSILRDLIAAGERVQDLAYDSNDNALAIVSSARAEVAKVASRTFCAGTTHRVADLAYDTSKHLVELMRGETRQPAIPSGYGPLDRLLSGGFAIRELSIIGAYPSVGKTSFAMNVALHMAGAGHRVLFFSLEMTKERIMQSAYQCLAGIPSERLVGQGEPLSEAEWESFHRATNTILDWGERWWIDDSDGLRVRDFEARIRDTERQHGLPDVVIVDYLQRVAWDKQYQNEATGYAHVAKDLKSLARETATHVMCLSQLTRPSSENPNPRPVMNKFFGSSRIEQEADYGIGLWRENYQDLQDRDGEADERLPGSIEPVEAIVLKHRNGATGTAHLRWQRHYRRFL